MLLDCVRVFFFFFTNTSKRIHRRIFFHPLTYDNEKAFVRLFEVRVDKWESITMIDSDRTK